MNEDGNFFPVGPTHLAHTPRPHPAHPHRYSHFDPKKFRMLIFLELVGGGSIASMLRRFGSFSEDIARNYSRQVGAKRMRPG